jgi:hypothetical protein
MITIRKTHYNYILPKHHCFIGLQVQKTNVFTQPRAADGTTIGMHTLTGLPTDNVLLPDDFVVGSHDELSRTYKEVRNVFASTPTAVAEWTEFVNKAPTDDNVSAENLQYSCVIRLHNNAFYVTKQVQNYMRAHNISLHVPLGNLLFSSAALAPSLVSSSTTASVASDGVPQFNTTDCVARQGYNPPRNVYRVPVQNSTDAVGNDTPVSQSLPPLPLVGGTEDAEEIDEQGWKVVAVACFLRGK